MLANLNDVLKPAMRGGYAVGLFNTIDTDMLEGVIAAAENMHAPLIIGTAEILLPYGELKLIAPSVIAAAERASVPVVVHYDHGLTFERCMEALKLGFTSVMFDGSLTDYEQNVAQTREVVKIAHAFGATVEGEIGHVGNADTEADLTEDRYTTVTEATRYLNDTGVDALAVAVGTAHGAYKTKPKLALDRLQAIRDAVDVPLVLHGGSGLSDDDFRNAVHHGIAKINIFTDLCLAGVEGWQHGVQAGMDYLGSRNEKVRAIQQAAERKMTLFGCQNKA